MYLLEKNLHIKYEAVQAHVVHVYISGTKQSPEIDPHVYMYGQQTFDKDVKVV